MPSITDARETVYQTWATDWGVTTPYTFANEDPEGFPPVNEEWARVSMQHLLGNQETLGGVGNRKFSREGLVTIQLFGPLDSGLRTLDGLVTTARAIYEGKTIDGIRFTDASVQEIGRSEGWFQINIDINFTYDEIK